MRAILLLLTAIMLAGCITMPDFDGTSRDVPAVDEYRFTVKYSSQEEIENRCRNRYFVGGKLVIETNDAPVEACSVTTRNLPANPVWDEDGNYNTDVYIKPPKSKQDYEFWKLLIHELAHPIFDWRH